MSIGMRVEGYDEIRRAIRKAADEGMKQALVKANKDIANAVVDRALPRIPVRTGRLRAATRGLGNLSGAVGKSGGARVLYAAAIHWGRKAGGVITARPYLYDAARHIERDVEDRYLAEIDRILEPIRAR